MTGADFTFTESRVADALGLPKKTIKQARADALEQGTDWIYDVGSGGAVRYSRGGVGRMLQHLGLHEGKIAALLPPPAEPPTPAPEPPTTPGPVAEPPIDSPADFAPNVGPLAEGFRMELLGLFLARAGSLEALAPTPLDLSAPETVEVTVTRTFHLNRRIIHGRIGGDPVRVRVRDSQKLRPGMALRCAHVDEDLYELAERLPRYPGKR